MASNLSLLFVLVLCFKLVHEGVYGVINAPSFTSAAQIVGAQGPAPDGTCKSMVEIYGYECQEHTVTTQDGYILSMQRIPEGRSKITGSKTPVLLQHGVLMDGITWLLNSPDQSLAFILADSGFDVWIANSRGTLWSRGHTSLGPSDPAYWEWSWDELVAYDLPAFVQYVYDQTDQKLNYVGHSLGTLIALASLSQSKLLDMVNSAVLLSPIAHLGQVSSLISQAAANAFIGETFYWLGMKEFDPKGEAVAKLINALCKEPGVDCYDLMTSFTGKNCCLNSSTVQVFLEHEPQPTATRNMIHLAQKVVLNVYSSTSYGCSWIDGCALRSLGKSCYQVGKFPSHIAHVVAHSCKSQLHNLGMYQQQPLSDAENFNCATVIREGTIAMYDYGDSDENMKHYGQPTPPIYNMSSIPSDFPLFLSYGGQDELSDANDVKLLLNDLKSHESDKITVQYRDDYAHADFVMGVNAKQDVYDPMIAFFKLQ